MKTRRSMMRPSLRFEFERLQRSFKKETLDRHMDKIHLAGMRRVMKAERFRL